MPNARVGVIATSLLLGLSAPILAAEEAMQLFDPDSPGDRVHKQPMTSVDQLVEKQATPPVKAYVTTDRDRPQSPTVQLSGEAAIVGAGGASREAVRPSVGQRLRLDLEVSFTGNDQLRLRLQNTNVAEFDEVFETDLARLSIQGDDGAAVSLSRLDYQFALGPRTQVFLPVFGGSISDVADPLNPGLSGSGRGSVARFSQRNPLYRQGGGAGVGMTHQVSDRLDLHLGYLSEADNLLPEDEYIAFAQATYQLSDGIEIGLLYTYGFNALDTGTGQTAANDPFAERSDAITAHSIGLQATARITPDLQVSGWTGLTQAIATDLPRNPNATILNWAVALSSPDLLGKDHLGGLVIGAPPWVLSGHHSSNPSVHLELFQQLQLQDNITLTPGFVMILNPEDNGRSPSHSPIILGTVRMVLEL